MAATEDEAANVTRLATRLRQEAESLGLVLLELEAGELEARISASQSRDLSDLQRLQRRALDLGCELRAARIEVFAKRALLNHE